MTLSILSSQRLVPANTCPDASSWTWSQPSLTKLELVPTDNSSIQSNSSLEKKMLLTTSPEVTIPLERKSSISAWTESGNWLTNVLDSKDSWSSTQSEEVLDPVLDHSFWRDSPLITVRSPNSDSPCIHHPRFQPPSLNHTTQCSPPTPSLSTLMLLLCWTMRPATISAEETWTLRDLPTPT